MGLNVNTQINSATKALEVLEELNKEFKDKLPADSSNWSISDMPDVTRHTQLSLAISVLKTELFRLQVELKQLKDK